MTVKWPAALVILSLLVFFALTAVAKADIAPPIMVVNVQYNGSYVNGTFYSAALSCMNGTNASAYGIPVPQLNVSEYDAAKGCYWEYYRGAECADGTCSFEELPLSSFKMAFYLPSVNRTFITNETNASGYTTYYDAQLYPNGSATIGIANNPPIPPVPIPSGIYALFAMALAFTLAIEIAVAFLYLKAAKVKKKGRILLTVLLANIISVPIVWFVVLIGIGWGLLLGEAFAVVFEGCFIYLLNRKAISLKSAMLMSILMNIASLVIGGLILLYL